MKRLSAAVLFFFLAVAPSFAWGGEVSVLKIEGSAAKAEFEADTKKEALESALRGSVETAVRKVMKAEDILENTELIEDRIYPNPMNYILNYRILSEGWITHFDMPEDTVGPEGIEGEALESADGAEFEVGADGELVEVAVEDMAEGEAIGEEGDIIPVEEEQAVVVDESQPPAEEPALARRHRKGSLAESSFFTPTAEDIEEGIVDGRGEGVSGGALLYHIWIEARVDIDRLKGDVKGFSDVEEAETTTVNIEILGVKDHKRFEELKKRLEALEIIKELGYDSFSRGRYVMRASVAGSGHDLYDRLKGTMEKDLVLIPGGAGRIIIKLEGRAF